MNTQRRIIAFAVFLIYCAQAQAITCDHHPIELGESFSTVTKLCDEAVEYVYTYTQKETITDDTEGRVKLSREHYDSDALIYYDYAHHLKVTLTFRDNRLFDIVSEQDKSNIELPRGE